MNSEYKKLLPTGVITESCTHGITQNTETKKYQPGIPVPPEVRARTNNCVGSRRQREYTCAENTIPLKTSPTIHRKFCILQEIGVSRETISVFSNLKCLR